MPSRWRAGRGRDTQVVDLPPGTHLLYCGIPGHRATMELELVVE